MTKELGIEDRRERDSPFGQATSADVRWGRLMLRKDECRLANRWAEKAGRRREGGGTGLGFYVARARGTKIA